MNHIRRNTVLGWFVLVGFMGWLFVHRAVHSTVDAEYTRTWTFGIIMFCILRLPLYLLALFVVLFLESKYLSKAVASSR
jgi:hypothetical protein